MKKHILKTSIRLILIAVMVGIAVVNFTGKSDFTVQAVGGLTVNWNVPEDDPIFVVANMAPGDSETRDVTITNDDTVPRTVGVKGVKTSEIQDLSTVIDFVMTEGATTIHSSTLAQFFTDTADPHNSVSLFTLVPGESKTVTFDATFQESAGNGYQSSSVVFNLIIGLITDVPLACEGMTFNGETIFGTAGDDVITGTNKRDLIFSLEGNDVIEGGNGDDCIVAGTGNDSADGGTGADRIFGESGEDEIIGGNGDDILSGGENNDTIYGGNGTDLISGDEGDDTIYGGNGSDILEDNFEVDELFGNNGNDTLIAGPGGSSADGGRGFDTCQADIEIRCEASP